MMVIGSNKSKMTYSLTTTPGITWKKSSFPSKGERQDNQSRRDLTTSFKFIIEMKNFLERNEECYQVEITLINLNLIIKSYIF